MTSLDTNSGNVFRPPPVDAGLPPSAPPDASRPGVNRPGITAATPPAPPAIANNPRLEVRAPRYAAVPAMPVAAEGLRVMPLAGFAWSGPGGRPRPRGDHALIWRDAAASGAAELRLPSGTVPLSQGTVYFLPVGTDFAIAPQPRAGGVVVLIPRQLAGDCPAPFPPVPVCGALSPTDRMCVGASLAALAAGGWGAEARIAAHCHLGVIALSLGHMRASAGAAGGATPGNVSGGASADPRVLVGQFLDLAANEVGRGRTLGDLAAVLGTTAGHLDRVCLAARGRGAMALIYEIRRERAVAMLRDTRLPPARIAAMLGFSSLAHMNRQLCDATGRGPQGFRGTGV